jgi:hypothetical protein
MSSIEQPGSALHSNQPIESSEPAAAAKAPDNSMSMAKPPETKVYVLNQMNAITGKALTVPIEEGVYFAQGGQVGKSTTG